MKLEEQESDLLARATAEWKAAQILRTDPAWNGKPSASHFIEILSSKPEFESKLIELLNSDNQLIVAYSLFTLSLMKSSVLENQTEACTPVFERSKRHSQKSHREFPYYELTRKD